MTQRKGILRLGPLHPSFHQLAEGIQLVERSLVDVQLEHGRLSDDGPQAHAMQVGSIHNLAYRRIADASCRIVDDALQRLLVIRIGHQPEVGDDVLDFLALVEAQSAVDAVGNVLLAHVFLKRAALRIGAVEYGKVAVRTAFLPHDAPDVVTHYLRLLLVAVGRLQDDALTLLLMAIHVFVYLPLVVANQAVGSLHNELRRAVVLLQLEESGTFVALLEVQDVVDVGTTETVDALGVVAHHADTLTLLGQLHDNGLLGVVRVLVLIHQHVGKAVHILPAHLLMFAEQQEGLHQQVVKVHGVRLSAALGITPVDVLDGRNLPHCVVGCRGAVGVGSWQQQVVLSHRDTISHTRCLIDLVVQLHLADNALDQRSGVALVVDGEVGVVAYVLCLTTEDACKDGVERAHLQVARPLLPHQQTDALLHLTRRLVGKCQGQDAPGLQLVFLQQPGNLVGQYACLTRPRTGYHQLGAVAPYHRLALAVVQLI